MLSRRITSDLVRLVPEFWIKVDDWYEAVFESWKFGLIPLDLKPGTAVDGLRKVAPIETLTGFPGLWAKEGTHILLSGDKQYLRSRGPSRLLPNASGVRESVISLDVLFQYEALNPSFAATLAASRTSAPDNAVPRWMEEQVAVLVGESAGSRISTCLASFPEYFANSGPSPTIGFVKPLAEQELFEAISARPSTATEIFHRLKPSEFGAEHNFLLDQLMMSKFVYSSCVDGKLQFQTKR
jgi:hypothetical protein